LLAFVIQMRIAMPRDDWARAKNRDIQKRAAREYAEFGNFVSFHSIAGETCAEQLKRQQQMERTSSSRSRLSRVDDTTAKSNIGLAEVIKKFGKWCVTLDDGTVLSKHQKRKSAEQAKIRHNRGTNPQKTKPRNSSIQSRKPTTTGREIGTNRDVKSVFLGPKRDLSIGYMRLASDHSCWTIYSKDMQPLASFERQPEAKLWWGELRRARPFEVGILQQLPHKKAITRTPHDPANKKISPEGSPSETVREQESRIVELRAGGKVKKCIVRWIPMLNCWQIEQSVYLSLDGQAERYELKNPYLIRENGEWKFLIPNNRKCIVSGWA
jgi:hypothetical protein